MANHYRRVATSLPVHCSPHRNLMGARFNRSVAPKKRRNSTSRTHRDARAGRSYLRSLMVPAEAEMGVVEAARLAAVLMLQLMKKQQLLTLGAVRHHEPRMASWMRTKAELATVQILPDRTSTALSQRYRHLGIAQTLGDVRQRQTCAQELRFARMLNIIFSVDTYIFGYFRKC